MLKVDRTSMANSLEVRSPFVDHKLIEYIYSHEESYHEINNPKSILKNYLSTDFDASFLNRRKMGFIFDVEKFIFSNIGLTYKENIILNLKLGQFPYFINTRKKKKEYSYNRLFRFYWLSRIYKNIKRKL